MWTCFMAALGCLVAAPGGETSVEVDSQRLTVRTATVEAVFDGPRLTHLRPAGRDVEFIHDNPADPGIDLVYLNDSRVGTDKHQNISVRRISERAARITVAGADTTRSILITVDPVTGDICVTPDGVSNRRGLRAVQWNLALRPDATAILPVVNGLIVKPDQPHPGNRRFPWPFKWEAQLAIAEKQGWSVMVHCQDNAHQFKALRLTRDGERTILGFESEPPGPLWDTRTAGGVEWRINAYQGEWKVPAERYRNWTDATHDLDAKRLFRPEWIDQITLAICWAHPNPVMLDALAAVHPPEQTLVHLSDWRAEKYDVNYPDYTPREQAIAYMNKANAMGFHVLPHFNYWAVYYDHPTFAKVGHWQTRSVDLNQPEGWHWPPETHDYTRMAYIHPGLGLWREIIIDAVLQACGALNADGAFIDQTLCTWNTDNGLVQGMNTVEGMRMTQEQFSAIAPELVLAGEGLTEISFQRQCFAQAHIHEGWGALEQMHVEAAHPICAFLWQGHSRLIGYYHLNPDNNDFQFGIETYERMNAIPTIITNNPEHITEMSALTRRIFDRAKTAPVKP